MVPKGPTSPAWDTVGQPQASPRGVHASRPLDGYHPVGGTGRLMLSVLVVHLEHIRQGLDVVRIGRSRTQSFAHLAGQVGGHAESVPVPVPSASAGHQRRWQRAA